MAEERKETYHSQYPTPHQTSSSWRSLLSPWIPLIPDGIYFCWDPTLFGDSIPPIFYMESTWNGQILSGFHHSIWIPHGMMLIPPPFHWIP